MRRLTAALTLALLLPLPALAGQITVKPGETLSEIADRLGISVSRLMQMNGISKADHVEAGQVLKVPGSSGGGGSGRSAAAASGRVTVQEGDTLSEIADRSGMSLQQLMTLNGLSKADHIEVGQVLKVRGSGSAAPAAPTYRRGASEHVVRPGESLSEIADGYGISMSKLVAINAIGDPDHVEAGSRLRLKGEPPSPRPAERAAAAPRPTPKPAVRVEPAVTRSAAEPETAQTAPAPDSGSGASATAPAAIASATAAASAPIARSAGSPERPASSATLPSRAITTATQTPAPGRGSTEIQTAVRSASPAANPVVTTVASTPVSRATTPVAVAPVRTTAPVASAPATRPITTTAATTATAPTTTTSGWRRYGPLQVDWSNWQPMGGSLVAPILTAKGDTLYLAINCSARKLNATSVNGDWRTWDDPQADFERRLVNDLCSTRG